MTKKKKNIYFHSIILFYFILFCFVGTVGSAPARVIGVCITKVTAEGNSSAQAGPTVGIR